MYSIETSIPFPASPGWKAKYPWRELDVGQSFFVSDVKFRTMQAGASLAGRRLNKQFRARIVDGGVRIWRIA